MIFKRKKNNNSPTSIGDSVDEKISSKAETLYVAVMCFTAACLSCMTLEVGARSPLGQSVARSPAFNAIFRRNYNMKIKMTMTNVVMGVITTIILALGDIYRVPYLHVPWLFNTMRGMIFNEGPALLRLYKDWLPRAGIPAVAFAFITLLLLVEELCLWLDIFGSSKNCWNEYMERKAPALQTKLPTEDDNNLCNIEELRNLRGAEKSDFLNNESKSIAAPTNILMSSGSTYSTVLRN